jgi:hypothetical protein
MSFHGYNGHRFDAVTLSRFCYMHSGKGAALPALGMYNPVFDTISDR